jgi:hypothetical protein
MGKKKKQEARAGMGKRDKQKAHSHKAEFARAPKKTRVHKGLSLCAVAS